MKPYLYLSKYLIVLTLLDALVLGTYIWWEKPTPDVSIAELLIIPTILIINITLALASHYGLRNKTFGKVFALNAVIAAVLFHYLFQAWFVVYGQTHFKRYYFKRDGKQYEVTLDKQYHAFTLSDISDKHKGSTTSLLTGDYKTLADSIVLTDSTKQMVISNEELIGYPKVGDVVKLKEDN